MGLKRTGYHRVHIAFGGNLGDVRGNFIQAREELGALDEIKLIKSSKLYQTPPVGPSGQPDYLNAVIAIETSLKPVALLATTQHIEHAHGRIRAERWGARTLDLDILTYADTQLSTELLTIPHKMIGKRMFVLRPLCDIADKWQHPLLNITAKQMLDKLIAEGESLLPEGEVW